MKKNQIIKLEISDVSLDSKGIGKHEKMVVFTPNCAVNDYIEAKILKVNRNYCFAKLEKIIKPSPDRIAVDCKAYPKCGGCSFRHISYESELKIKEKSVRECINRLAGLKDVKIDPIISADSTDFYRNKMQLPVRKDKNGNIVSGFYRNFSHDIVKTDSCRLNPDIFDKIVEDIKRWMIDYKIKPYEESENLGIIRHIYLRQAEKTGEIMVCLVVNSDDIEYKNELVEILLKKYGKIVGILMNINKNSTNVILGEKDKIIYGRNYIRDNLCEVDIHISSKSFYQINHSQTERLYKTLKSKLNLTGNETVLELYCGIGSIGLSLSKYVRNLIGVEIVKEAVENANTNAKINNIKNATFICGDSNEKIDFILKKFKNPDVVILDPPRKGCKKELIDKISEINPNKIGYVSCNPATLARDIKEFFNKGFEINYVVPVDLFPRTAHVEIVCILSKKV